MCVLWWLVKKEDALVFIQTFGHWLVTVFGNIMEALGDRVLLEKSQPWDQALGFDSLAPLLVLSFGFLCVDEMWSTGLPLPPPCMPSLPYGVCSSGIAKGKPFSLKLFWSWCFTLSSEKRLL